MKTTASRNAFSRCVSDRYEPDTDIICAICGCGIYRGDPVSWDDHNQICHAKCVEEEVHV